MVMPPVISQRLPDKSGILAFLLAFVFLAGCANAPPVQEMSDARQAIAAATEAGADDHAAAAAQLSEAQDLLDEAEAYLDTGTSSAYWQAKKAAVGAKEIAFEALLNSRNANDASVQGSP
jgi:outer membrane murein-binding lipoprotein Lpp